MRTRTKIGLAVAGVGAVLAAATAFAFGGHHGAGGGVMKRVVVAVIDDALDQAGGVTPEQRAAVHAARDRVLAAFETHRATRLARRDEVLRLFEAEPLDAARLATLRQEIEADHRQIADAIGQALGDVHQALTPAQRQAVAAYVRSHRHAHWGRPWGGHRG